VSSIYLCRMTGAMQTAFLSVRERISDDRGEIGVAAVVGGLILLVAFLTFKHEFFHFFHYLMHSVFSALNSSFGSNDAGMAGHHAHAATTGAASGNGNGNSASTAGHEAKSAIGPSKGAR
jgi:hypothetical protein